MRKGPVTVDRSWERGWGSQAPPPPFFCSPNSVATGVPAPGGAGPPHRPGRYLRTAAASTSAGSKITVL